MQNSYSIKDQELNEIRKIMNSEKIWKEKEKSKMIIKLKKLVESIGWNQDEKNNMINRFLSLKNKKKVMTLFN